RAAAAIGIAAHTAQTIAGGGCAVPTAGRRDRRSTRRRAVGAGSGGAGIVAAVTPRGRRGCGGAAGGTRTGDGRRRCISRNGLGGARAATAVTARRGTKQIQRTRTRHHTAYRSGSAAAGSPRLGRTAAARVRCNSDVQGTCRGVRVRRSLDAQRRDCAAAIAGGSRVSASAAAAVGLLIKRQ